MKGNKKLLVIAALFLFVGVGVATYAIYKTSVSGTATVTAAKWNVKFKNGATELEDNFTVTLSGTDCQNTHVAAGKIAPGATCTKQIVLDAADTEVDVTYTVTAGNVVATKNNTEISTQGANAFTVSLLPATGTIEYNDTDKTATLTLTVAWAGNDGDNTTPTSDVNSYDTALNGATLTVPITLVAKQVPVSNS